MNKSGITKTALYLLLFTSLSLTSIAQLKVCNETNSDISFAYAYRPGGVLLGTWTSYGWYDVPAGRCRTIHKRSVRNKNYYWYAVSKEYSWGGDYYICVDPNEAFVIKGADYCSGNEEKRGFQRFWSSNHSYTVNIYD